MQIFLSFASVDRPKVEYLAGRLRQASISVWLDSDLIESQECWDEILGQLRSCDAVVAAVSRASLSSQVCQLVIDYAAQLGKRILRLALEPLGAEISVEDPEVDYSQPNETAIFKLTDAILALPKAKPLPDPLPKPPRRPTAALETIDDRTEVASKALLRMPKALWRMMILRERQKAVVRLEHRHLNVDAALVRKLAEVLAWLEDEQPDDTAQSSERRMQLESILRLDVEAPLLYSLQLKLHKALTALPRGISYDELVCSAYAELVQPGRLLFNPPDRMQLGGTERVEVRLTRTLELDAALLSNLRGHGEPQLEEIPVAPLMAVTLKSDGFQITAYSDEEQSVAKDSITTWEFDIRALKRGPQQLILCVSLRVPVEGQPLEHKSIPVREVTIDVQVGAAALVAHFVAANWQWIIGTAIAIAAVVAAVKYG